jgi:hypothetical protein
MAIGLYFAPEGFTKSKYDDTLKKLDEAGAGSPPGRLYHFALETENGNIHVYDVWESEETFQKFGETLIPIMSSVGVEPGKPMVMPVHNVIKG